MIGAQNTRAAEFFRGALYILRFRFILMRLKYRSHSGDNGDEGPPVPIPNTEVKLVRGESTWHIAPGRITRCRISIKNDRFQAKNGHFSFVLTIFLYDNYVRPACHLIEFWAQNQSFLMGNLTALCFSFEPEEMAIFIKNCTCFCILGHVLGQKLGHNQYFNFCPSR